MITDSEFQISSTHSIIVLFETFTLLVLFVARKIYLCPGKGVHKPENFVKFFPKVYPLPLCNYFYENGFQQIVQLMNI